MKNYYSIYQGIRLLYYCCGFRVVKLLDLFVRALRSHEAAQHRSSFRFTCTLPPKTKNRLPPKQIPPCFHYRRKKNRFYHLPPKQCRPKPRTGYRQKITAVLHYRRKSTAIFVVTAQRQSRYRQKPKYRLPTKNYRPAAIPPRLSPPKRPLTTLTLVFLVPFFWLARFLRLSPFS